MVRLTIPCTWGLRVARDECAVCFLDEEKGGWVQGEIGGNRGWESKEEQGKGARQ